MTTNRPLHVFLCHSSNDKSIVRELYQKLRAESWIQPWLDEEELYPGQDWNLEIEKAIEETDVIIVCLSNNSTTKEGYVQKEIKTALDYSDYKPEGTVFIIPVRLEDCKPPNRLSKWQYADYFEGQRERGYKRLLVSLERRASSLDLKIESSSNKIALSNGMEFMRVPAGKFPMGSVDYNNLPSFQENPHRIVDIPYDYWMMRFPVTNELYDAYTKSKAIQHPVNGWEKKRDHPVVVFSWDDAKAYCQWLNNLLKAELPQSLILRLSTETEWEKAARGTDGREYPWGNTFDINRCNTKEGGKGGTTPVGYYSPQGDSPYGCADMAGNEWEWADGVFPFSYIDRGIVRQFSLHQVVRSGSFSADKRCACCAFRGDGLGTANMGFRVVIAPLLSQ